MYIQKINLCVSIIIIVMGFSVKNIETASSVLFKNSLENFVRTPLNETKRLASDPHFDRNHTTVLYVFGFMGSPNGTFTRAILNAYIMSAKRPNVILVDWQQEAQSGPLGTSVSYVLSAVPNTIRIGNELCQALVDLKNVGVDLNKIHLVGHSLGAHIMGFAGQCLKSKGIAISRITGLDPAGPSYDGFYPKKFGLDDNSATTVVVIHTNPGKLGTSESRGTADFWPNYSSDGQQPGCPRGNYPVFSEEGLCSHNRAILYMIESINSEKAFLAASAENYNAWLTLKTLPNYTAYMGDSTDPKASGNYYLTTNGQEPFSKGPEGAIPEQSDTYSYSTFAQ